MPKLPQLKTRRDFDLFLEQILFGKTNSEILEEFMKPINLSRITVFRGREFCGECRQEINLQRCPECHQTIDTFYK